jgi:hypothetical protein
MPGNAISPNDFSQVTLSMGLITLFATPYGADSSVSRFSVANNFIHGNSPMQQPGKGWDLPAITICPGLGTGDRIQIFKRETIRARQYVRRNGSLSFAFNRTYDYIASMGLPVPCCERSPK